MDAKPLERRFCELRADAEGRILEGVAVRYDDVAALPWGLKERILPGAFGESVNGDVILNAQHNRERPLARTPKTLTIVDTPQALSVRAVLPETRDADDVLRLVSAGVLSGLSIEFRVSRERMIGGVREVSGAKLSAVAVVDRPAYPKSEVSARQTNDLPRFWL